MRPLAVDLCAGLGGWSEGLLAEGWDVVGFDVCAHQYGEHRYPSQLVLQDIRKLDGRQFRGKVSLIVASPPCQNYSYMAMPWKRSKLMAEWYRDASQPQRLVDLNELFNACVRIGIEADCPTVIENVRGAQPWIGRSRGSFGSFHLWGDVPALMPIPIKRGVKVGGLDWSKHGDPDYKSSGAGGCFGDSAIKNTGGSWFRVAHNTTSGKGQNPDGRPLHTPHMTNPWEHDDIKCPGDWFSKDASLMRQYSSKSTKRKFASALIAKIPFELSSYIGRVYKPQSVAA